MGLFLCGTVLISIPFAQMPAILLSEAFAPPPPLISLHWHPFVATTRRTCVRHRTDLFASKLDASLLDAAGAKLSWEVIEERESKPVLDLNREFGGEDAPLSLSEAMQTSGEADGPSATVGDEAATEVAAEAWESGEIWMETRNVLVEKGVLTRDSAKEGIDEDGLLASVPQLLRLETDQVGATVEAILDSGIPIALARSEPMVLTYPPSHIEGGLEFLGTMMMMPREVTITVCGSTPGLFLGAVEGWMQEQAVKRALGEAGAAADGANQKIAGDVAQGLRALRRRPPGASSLGG